MNITQWEKHYRLGVPAMDADHQLLIDHLAEFLNGVEARLGAAELAARLNRLIEETRQHFRREEDLLDRYNYPGLAAHKAEHQVLLSQARHFQERYEAGDIDLHTTTELGEFLHHWLVDHLQKDDRAYVPFLQRIA